MPRALSSVLTFFWKFIFPVVWFSGTGLLTLLAFTGSQGFTQRDTWVFLASLLLGCFFLFFVFPTIRLKRVQMDGEFLYISNYLTEAKVPLRDVLTVSVLTLGPLSARGPGDLSVKPFVVVEFQGQTPFGNRIIFMAKGIAASSVPWTHPIVTELRQAVDRALLGSMPPGEFAPRDLGRAREEARKAEVRRLARPGKPTLRLQERYVRRSGLLWHLFGIPGGGFLICLVLAVIGARAASLNFANTRTLATGASAAILIGFTLFFTVYFVQVLRFWLGAPARLVLYFERRLDAKSWGAFKKGFALAQGFDVLERRASQLDVTPLSAFGFGDDLLGQVVVWHGAGNGLKTVRALLTSSHREALDPNLLEDLQAIEVVLERAEAAAVRFAIVVRIGADDLISPHEINCRKGSFW